MTCFQVVMQQCRHYLLIQCRVWSGGRQRCPVILCEQESNRFHDSFVKSHSVWKASTRETQLTHTEWDCKTMVGATLRQIMSCRLKCIAVILFAILEIVYSEGCRYSFNRGKDITLSVTWNDVLKQMLYDINSSQLSHNTMMCNASYSEQLVHHTPPPHAPHSWVRGGGSH